MGIWCLLEFHAWGKYSAFPLTQKRAFEWVLWSPVAENLWMSHFPSWSSPFFFLFTFVLVFPTFQFILCLKMISPEVVWTSGWKKTLFSSCILHRTALFFIYLFFWSDNFPLCWLSANWALRVLSLMVQGLDYWWKLGLCPLTVLQTITSPFSVHLLNGLQQGPSQSVKEAAVTASLGPWLVWLSALSASLRSKGTPVWLPIRAQAWAVGWVPSRGSSRGSHTLMFLSLYPSLPLSKNK